MPNYRAERVLESLLYPEQWFPDHHYLLRSAFQKKPRFANAGYHGNSLLLQLIGSDILILLEFNATAKAHSTTAVVRCCKRYWRLDRTSQCEICEDALPQFAKNVGFFEREHELFAQVASEATDPVMGELWAVALLEAIDEYAAMLTRTFRVGAIVRATRKWCRGIQLPSLDTLAS